MTVFNPFMFANLGGDLLAGARSINANSGFNNPMLLQFMTAAGEDISSGNPIGTNVGKTVQQNISSQNFMKLLQKMLGGEVPEGGKMEISDTGMKMHIPATAYTLSGQAPKASTPAQQSAVENPFINPSYSSAGISASDLAGLSPEMISQALQFKMAQDELKNKSIMDVVDMQYKRALTEQALANAEADRRPKDTRTNEQKNYEYYVAQQSKLGQPVKTIAEWDKDTQTAHQKDYEYYKNQGGDLSFHEWLRDITALGGGLSLEDYAARKATSEDIEAKSNITSADFFTKTEKIVKEDPTLDQYLGTPEYDKQVKLETLKRMDSAIRNAYKDKKVTRTAEGWLVDKKIIRRNPYAK